MGQRSGWNFNKEEAPKSGSMQCKLVMLTAAWVSGSIDIIHWERRSLTCSDCFDRKELKRMQIWPKRAVHTEALADLSIAAGVKILGSVVPFCSFHAAISVRQAQAHHHHPTRNHHSFAPIHKVLGLVSARQS